jgi:hypothetical protein
LLTTGFCQAETSEWISESESESTDSISISCPSFFNLVLRSITSFWTSSFSTAFLAVFDSTIFFVFFEFELFLRAIFLSTKYPDRVESEFLEELEVSTVCFLPAYFLPFGGFLRDNFFCSSLMTRA